MRCAGGQDYYDEGALIWLSADALIRTQSQGRVSLDDFLRIFLGQRDTGPTVVPYTREEVESALSAAWPFDWHKFFEERVYKVNSKPPTDGLEAAGWRLVYNETPNNKPFYGDLPKAPTYYSGLTNFPEMEFVIPGPGAKGGISKCFESLGGLSEADIIRVITERQDREFERLGINFQSLWGRPLQLIDCQNLFCDVDKYSRVRHPELSGNSQRTRIKQRFRASTGAIDYFYPPKWGINEAIKAERDAIEKLRR